MWLTFFSCLPLVIQLVHSFNVNCTILVNYVKWWFVKPDMFVPGQYFWINEFFGLLNRPLVQPRKSVPALFVRTSVISVLSEPKLTNHHCYINQQPAVYKMPSPKVSYRASWKDLVSYISLSWPSATKWVIRYASWQGWSTRQYIQLLNDQEFSLKYFVHFRNGWDSVSLNEPHSDFTSNVFRGWFGILHLIYYQWCTIQNHKLFQ